MPSLRPATGARSKLLRKDQSNENRRTVDTPTALAAASCIKTPAFGITPPVWEAVSSRGDADPV
jgi:hypothetical protein